MDFTSPEYLDHLETFLRLIRNRRYAEIARHALAESQFVKKHLQTKGGATGSDEEQKLSDLKAGKHIVFLIIQLIESLKSAMEANGSDVEQEQLHYLYSWIVSRQSTKNVEVMLGVGRAKGWQVRRNAVATLALKLQEQEDARVSQRPRVPNNLRNPSFYYHEFVGRYDPKMKAFFDDWIIRDLDRPGRIVNLYGPPGAGKTALAYRIAFRCTTESDFQRIIWTSAQQEVWRPLEQHPRKNLPAQTTFDSMLDTIGKELEHREVLIKKTTEEKRAIVEEQLKQQKVLLLFDQLEKLNRKTLEEVEDFLIYLPVQSRAIVTARKPLLAPQNPVYLGKMPIPEAIKLINLTQAAIESSQQMTDAQKKEITEIADGNPWLIQHFLGRIMRGDTIAELKKISQRQAGNYLYKEMYQKMLNHGERKVLHSLSLVTGSLRMSAIERATGLRKRHVEDYLHQLRDVALARELADMDSGDVRYELPPVPRDFLKGIQPSTRLGERKVRDFLNEAYKSLAVYYVSELDALSHIDMRIDYQKWERENILEVMDWCDRGGQSRLLIELNDRMGLPLAVLGYVRERIKWGEKAKIACERAGKNFEKKKAWFEVYDIGWSHMRLGEVDRALAIFDRILRQSRRKKWKEVEALTLRNLGILARDQGDFIRGRQSLEDSLKLWEELQREDWAVSTRTSLGRLYLMNGDLDQAHDHLVYACEHAQKIGHRGERAESFGDLALVLYNLGRKAEARGLIEQAYEITRNVAWPAPSHAHVLICRARMELGDGYYPEARGDIQDALRIYRQLGIETSKKAADARAINEKLQQMGQIL